MDASLAEVLRSTYGIEPASVEPGERGFVAETWVVRSPQGGFFVKSLPHSRDAENIERALPIQRRLVDGGFDGIARPVTTVEGRLFVDRVEDVVIVYELIDGEWTKDFDFERYVERIARLHAMPVEPTDPVERFAKDAVTPALPVIEAAITGRFDDAIRREAQAEIVRRRDSLAEAAAAFARSRARLTSGSGDGFVLTHSDAPNNVMVDRASGELWLVDWDDLLVGPRERDTWFHLREPEAATRFLAHYRRWVPDYEPDRDVVRHYVLVWLFEEVEGLVAPILAASSTPEVRARHLRWFRSAVPSLEAALERLDAPDPPWAGVGP